MWVDERERAKILSLWVWGKAVTSCVTTTHRWQQLMDKTYTFLMNHVEVCDEEKGPTVKHNSSAFKILQVLFLCNVVVDS